MVVMQFRLLLDENITPSIVPRLWQAGVDAMAVRDRGLLGASDYAVWKLAKAEIRTVVTINGRDLSSLPKVILAIQDW